MKAPFQTLPSKAAFSSRASHVALAILLLQSMALAECPIPMDGSLFVRVTSGHLIIDTSGGDTVVVEVTNPAATIEERCFDDHVEIEGQVPDRAFGPLDWRIRVPESINLDLLTFGGSVRISPTDGNVTARTTGGSVIAGDIGGNAAIITQGGSILAGDIQGNAELRSTGGGQIEIGNVGGNAELETIAGPITAGTVAGRVIAETNGGAISIRESRGQLMATTLAGDIVIGTAGMTRATTAGGNILAEVVRGPFVGTTELGDIRIDRAEGYIEATSGAGDIEANLLPVSVDGDLHVQLSTNSGNIRLTLPADLPADIVATAARTVLHEPTIRSNFAMESVSSEQDLPPALSNSFAVGSSIRKQAELNGGGNAIDLQTSRGAIEVRQVSPN
jgi:hypothetical protein